MSTMVSSGDNGSISTEEVPLLPEPVQATDLSPDLYATARLRLFMMLLLCNLSLQILIPTQTKIYEQIYCWQYYRDHNSHFVSFHEIPEQQCKIAPIQQQVASLKGWLEFYDSFPGLLMAIPLGIVADLVGRRPPLLLAISVIVLQQCWITFVTAFSDTIPVEAVWFEAVLNFLSGGKIVAEATLTCMVTDISAPNRLSKSLFRFTAISQFCKTVSPIIAAGLMWLNPWWAILIGMVLQGLMLLVTFAVPETLKQSPARASEGSIDDPVHDSKASLRTMTSICVDAFKELSFVWTNWRLTFVLLLCPVRMMQVSLSDLLQRYVSVRYSWSLASATMLYSLQAFAATIVLFLILPWMSDVLDTRFHCSPIKKNVILLQFAFLLAAMAYSIEGFAPNVLLLMLGLCIETFGIGLAASIRGLIATLIDQTSSGRVFSILAITESFSNMIAYPLIATLFSYGVDKENNMWLGLPFFVAGAMMLFAFLATTVIRLDRSQVVVA